MKNSLYTSADSAFSCAVEDASGTVMFTRKFGSFNDSQCWCMGMLRDELNGAFKILDTDTNRVLTDGRKINGEWCDYKIVNTELQMGIEAEMEHKDTIARLLIEANPNISSEELEKKVLSVIIEIAMTHLKEDAHYYSKLKQVEG